MATQKQLAFHVLVEEKDGSFVATCLETGLVATALDQDDAVAQMTKLITRTVEFAVKHHRLADIFHPAPNEVFQKYLSEPEPAFSWREQAIRTEHGQCGLAIKQTAYAAAYC